MLGPIVVINTIEDDDIIGFLDESSPQTTANTQKMLSFTKPEIWKCHEIFATNSITINNVSSN